MNRANMKLMWGENLSFKKSGAKAGRFSFLGQTIFLHHPKKKPVKTLYTNGFRIYSNYF